MTGFGASAPAEGSTSISASPPKRWSRPRRSKAAHASLQHPRRSRCEGKRVVVRVDLNVPIENGEVRDATRIERVVPTLRELLDKGAAVIVLAHFDRPKGKVVPEMSLKPVAPALEDSLGRPVNFVFTDWQAAPAVAVKPGECLLMENTRFHPGEEKNDAGFRKDACKPWRCLCQ